jgi:hypothetical protein
MPGRFRAREDQVARPGARDGWPYVGKRGRCSYVVGFYDHDRRERCRTFPSVRHARAWMDDYIIAERRGRESLRRFLLDLDAKETNALEARTIGQILELYLQVNAHPKNPGGLDLRALRVAHRLHMLYNRALAASGALRPQGLGDALVLATGRVRLGARGALTGRLDEWGKTAHSTQRRTTIPSLLQEDLAEWRETLEAFGSRPRARFHHLQRPRRPRPRQADTE